MVLLIGFIFWYIFYYKIFRALHGWKCKNKFIDFYDLVKNIPSFQKTIEPNEKIHQIYKNLSKRFQELEQKILQEQLFI